MAGIVALVVGIAWGSTDSPETLQLRHELRERLEAPVSATPDLGPAGTPAPSLAPHPTASPSCRAEVVTDDYGLEVEITTCD